MSSVDADLIRQSASVLAAAISEGEVSSLEVTKAHLARIAEVDERVHAFLQVTSEAALAAAELPKKMKAKVRTICDEYFVEVTAQLRSVKGNAVNETGCDRFFAFVNSYRCEFDSHGALAYASMDEAKAAICLQRWGK